MQARGPPEKGSQADILLSTLHGFDEGQEDSLQDGGQRSCEGARPPPQVQASRPVQHYYEAKRLLAQAVQLSSAIQGFIDRTASHYRELDDVNSILLEATLQRLQALKDFVYKLSRLQALSMESLEAMGGPAAPEELSDPKGWIPCDQLGRLSGWSSSSHQGQLVKAKQENQRLHIRMEALQRQVQVLSLQIQQQQRPHPRAHPHPPPEGASSVLGLLEDQLSKWYGVASLLTVHTSNRKEKRRQGPEVPGHITQAKTPDSQELLRLKRALEEKDELLSGVRVALRDVCNDRYPIVAERDELRQQVQAMLQAQQRIVDENAALQSRLEHVQGLYDALVTAQAHQHSPPSDPPRHEGEGEEVRMGRRPSLRIDLPVSSRPPAPVIVLHSPGGSGILDKRVSFSDQEMTITDSFSPSSSEASPRSPQQPQALRPPHPASGTAWRSPQPQTTRRRPPSSLVPDWLVTLVSPSRQRSISNEVILV